MPRSRGSDLPQRHSPRGAHAVRTSGSDSDPLHNRRSPRGTRIETRIADLESQLGQAQQELKSLKNQLSSAEDAKLEAQNELVKKVEKPLPLLVQVADKFQVKCTSKNVPKSNAIENKTQDIVPDDNEKETDVFEVPVENVVEKENKLTTPLAITEVEKPYVDELALKNDEIALLKSSLEYKWKEVESMSNENENLKNQLSEAVSKVSAAKTKEEGMILQLKQLGEELEANKANADKLNEKLKSVEIDKFAFEFEMKKLRVQTEQWRKAADAAAAVLAGDVGIRIPERCGSMDKHFSATFETPAGRYNGYVGSPGMADDFDDDFGTGKRKGSRIRMFGDLWKKKGQK